VSQPLTPLPSPAPARSKVIQTLPPAIFTLMKSTEPHSDVYYTFDVEVAFP